MSTWSPVDELTLSMKWAADEMAVDESPPHFDPNSVNQHYATVSSVLGVWGPSLRQTLRPFSKTHYAQLHHIYGCEIKVR